MLNTVVSQSVTSYSKASPHWTSNAHWNGLNVSTLNAHLLYPDPIQINTNPLPEVVSICIDLDRTIACCTWGLKKGIACTHVSTTSTVSVLLQATHCSTYLLISRRNTMDGWNTDLTKALCSLCGGVATWSQCACVTSFHIMQCGCN